MPEENQIQTSQTSTPIVNMTLKNDIRERLWWLRKQREEIKLRKAKEGINNMDNNSIGFYDKSLSVRDPQLSKRYHMASQSSAIAPIIKSYAENNWDDWSDLNDPQEILTEYLKLNPDDATYNRIMDFVQSDWDPEDFWVEMWWIKKDALDKAWDWAKWVWKWFLSFFETGWDAVRNAVNGAIEEIEQWTVFNPSKTDYTASAKENFAQRKYWKDYYSLTPEQKAEADYEVSTKEWYEENKPTAQRAVSKWMEAWLDAFFTIYAPWMKGAFSATWETPYLNYLNQWLGAVTEMGGYLINALPWLYQFRESLQTEEEKKERDQFVGSLWLMKLLKKRWEDWKAGRWNVRDTILREIDPATIVKEFQKRVMEAPEDIKQGVGKLKENLSKSEQPKVSNTTPKSPLQELRDTNASLGKESNALVTRIVKWSSKLKGDSTNKTKWSISRWLSELKEEDTSTYSDTYNALAKKWNEYKKQIDDILSKDTKTYWREDTMLDWREGVSGKSYKIDPVIKALDKMIEEFSERPNKRIKYEFYKEKVMNWEITLKELNDIARDFNTEYSDSMYAGDWIKEKTWLNAGAARELRTQLKAVVRKLWKETWLDELSKLEELDSRYHDNITAQEFIWDMVYGKDTFDATRHVKTEWEVFGDVLWRWTKALGAAKNLDIAWVKNAFSRWIPESASYAELEMELPRNINRLREINKSMSDNSKSISSMEKLDFSKEWEWLSKLRSKNANYMIASAENPMWKKATTKYNTAKTKAFRDFLDENWIKWKAQKWMYDNPEESQIIAIDNPQQRIIIDEWLEKNSPQNENIIIKWGEAYRYDPRTKEAYKVDISDPKKTPIDLPADASNFYSEIDGRRYQLPLYREEVEVEVSPESFLSVYNK